MQYLYIYNLYNKRYYFNIVNVNYTFTNFYRPQYTIIIINGFCLVIIYHYRIENIFSRKYKLHAFFIFYYHLGQPIIGLTHINHISHTSYWQLNVNISFIIIFFMMEKVLIICLSFLFLTLHSFNLTLFLIIFDILKLLIF